MESKNEKFLRMLDGRLPKAVHAIELLANLSRKQDYEWTPAQLQSMLDQLDDAVDQVAKAFGLGLTKVEELTAPPVSSDVQAAAAFFGKPGADERANAFALVAEARKIGDEELASATLSAIIQRWLEKE